MRKIFLDAGANNGGSTRKFRAKYDKECEYFIYSFEPNPFFFNNFKNIKKHILVRKAVWVEDTQLDFYLDKDPLKAGSTLIKSKKSAILDKKNPIKVEALDFSRWLKDNLSKDDHIILKMDIEGAEYKVLNKMIGDNTFSYIDELWIEWHQRKVRLPVEEHDALVSKINIPTKKWDALKW